MSKVSPHTAALSAISEAREELGRIADAARASSGTLTVGFHRRFAPLVREMAGHFSGRSEPLAMLYRINAGRIPLKSELAWVHDAASGGGRIIGEACHFVDTLQFLSGAAPVSVQVAHVNPRRADLAASDIVTVTITFDDGSIGTVHYFANGDASYPKERIEIFGQEKIAVLDNFRVLDLVAGNKTRRHRSLSVDKGFNGEVAAFVAACRTGEAAIPLESLLATTEVTLAAVEGMGGVGADDLVFDELPNA